MSVESKSQKLIGFATEFFTLWSLVEIKRFDTINDVVTHVSTDWKYTYIQNLSKSEEEAIRKFKERFNYEPQIDECLRGQTSSFTRNEVMLFPYTVFPFGKCQLMEIMKSDDVWQLDRVLSGPGALGHVKEFNTLKVLKRRVLARKRLIELGEIIKYKHTGDKWDDIEGEWIHNVELKYISKRDYNKMIEAQQSRFYHENGEKVTLKLKEVFRTGYDSTYGYVSIVTYENEIGYKYIYKGSSIPDLGDGDDFVSVKATIKHNEYRNIKQNMIQRVKLN